MPRRRRSPDAVRPGRIKLIWGGAERIRGHWRLGLWGVYQREVGSRPHIAISLRGVLLWLTAIAVSGYLVGATALYFWFRQSPYNVVTWSDCVLMPVRWDHVRELRGRAMIAEGLADLKEKRWGEAQMKLRIGLARAPRELEARRALAEFYVLANRRPLALSTLEDGLRFKYPGKRYLTTLFAVATQGEAHETIVTACDRFLPGETIDRAWLVTQKANALMALDRPADALAAVDAERDRLTPQLREARVLALVALGRADDAAAALEAWTRDAPADRAQILRLKVRVLREAGRLAEMSAAWAQLRELAPADPRTYVYGVVQTWLAGDAAGAADGLEDFFRRFGASSQHLLLMANALGEAKAAALVRRCDERAASHGFPRARFKTSLAQVQLATGDWTGALTTVAELKGLLKQPSAENEFVLAWMERVAGLAARPEDARRVMLLELLQGRSLPLRVYRETGDILVRAADYEGARRVLDLAQRSYPESSTLAALRTRTDEGLAALAAQSAAAEPVAANRPSGTADDFFDRLNRLETEERWSEALEAVRAIRLAKPGWLASRDAEVIERQLRLAARAGETLELLGAARQYLNGELVRAARVVQIARELDAAGRRTDAMALNREVLRRTPAFKPAVTLQESWDRPPEAPASQP